VSWQSGSLAVWQCTSTLLYVRKPRSLGPCPQGALGSCPVAHERRGYLPNGNESREMLAQNSGRVNTLRAILESARVRLERRDYFSTTSPIS
jgi:hypothetical protein